MQCRPDNLRLIHAHAARKGHDYRVAHETGRDRIARAAMTVRQPAESACRHSPSACGGAGRATDGAAPPPASTPRITHLATLTWDARPATVRVNAPPRREAPGGMAIQSTLCGREQGPETGHAAEGATALESLRHKGPQRR